MRNRPHRVIHNKTHKLLICKGGQAGTRYKRHDSRLLFDRYAVIIQGSLTAKNPVAHPSTGRPEPETF